MKTRYIIFTTILMVLDSFALSQSAQAVPTKSGTQDVNVVNTPSVRNIDSPARSAFTAANSGVLYEDTDHITLQMTTVAQGKRLVIEQVSVSHTLPTGAGQIKISAGIQTTAEGVTTQYNFIGGDAGSFTDNGFALEQFVASSQMKSYADPGTAVEVTVRRSDTGWAGLVYVSLSGYLIDVP